MYHKGILESKPRLVELSGINNFQRAINELIRDHGWLASRNMQQRLRVDRLGALIDQAILWRQVQVTDIQNWQTDRFNAWQKDFMTLATNVRERITRAS